MTNIILIIITCLLTYLAAVVSLIKRKVDSSTVYAQTNAYSDDRYVKTVKKAETAAPALHTNMINIEDLPEDLAIEALEKYGA